MRDARVLGLLYEGDRNVGPVLGLGRSRGNADEGSGSGKGLRLVSGVAPLEHTQHRRSITLEAEHVGELSMLLRRVAGGEGANRAAALQERPDGRLPYVPTVLDDDDLSLKYLGNKLIHVSEVKVLEAAELVRIAIRLHGIEDDCDPPLPDVHARVRLCRHAHLLLVFPVLGNAGVDHDGMRAELLPLVLGLACD